MGSEFYYDGSLEGFLALLDRFRPGDPADWPRRVMRHTGGAGREPGQRPDQRPGQRPGRRPEDPQGLLFDEGAAESGAVQVPPALFPDPASLGGAAAVLFQVSSGAYDALVHVWMSGLPLEAQALRYALGTLAAAEKAALAAEGPAGKIPGGCTVPWYAGSEAREGAERAARNRGDEDCRIVLAAAYKVVHEIDRLMGFLRFKPGAGGRYVARCAPDYLVLPALALHFTRRFGAAPWAVIDEKRGLVLFREGAEPRLTAVGKDTAPWGCRESGDNPLGRDFPDNPQGQDSPNQDSRGHDPRNQDPQGQDSWGQDPPNQDLRGQDSWGQDPPNQDPWGQDPWEKIWRSYHQVINIESRKNLRLQRQFVPLRYREYLNEFGPG